ncbi:BRO family protein [Pectobacterium polaris]|uniref:BRO family protein n=1 Tax=Pectobacterium polaris TaxID=2042057 RepID=UPI0032EDCB37
MKSVAKANSEFTIFKFGVNEIRVVNKDGEPWFVVADVCKALEIGNPTKAVKNLDDDEVALTSIQGLSRGNDEANIVSESGMYTLVLRCRDAIKPGTVPHSFRRWVTAEVLPAIRKTGQYEKPRKTTVDQRTPLRDAVNMLVGKKGLRYDDAYSMVHQRFNIDSIDELELEQIPLAVEYIHRVVLEGEFIGKQTTPVKSNFTDEEIQVLCWLWSYAEYMRDYMQQVYPILRVAEHRLAGAYCSMPQESPRTINAARRILLGATDHIDSGPTRQDNWRVLYRMRHEHDIHPQIGE